jgi:hypothetical protein
MLVIACTPLQQREGSLVEHWFSTIWKVDDPVQSLNSKVTGLHPGYKHTDQFAPAEADENANARHCIFTTDRRQIVEQVWQWDRQRHFPNACWVHGRRILPMMSRNRRYLLHYHDDGGPIPLFGRLSDQKLRRIV